VNAKAIISCFSALISRRVSVFFNNFFQCVWQLWRTKLRHIMHHIMKRIASPFLKSVPTINPLRYVEKTKLNRLIGLTLCTAELFCLSVTKLSSQFLAIRVAPLVHHNPASCTSMRFPGSFEKNNKSACTSWKNTILSSLIISLYFPKNIYIMSIYVQRKIPFNF